MTTIVALVDGETTWLGADSRATYGDHYDNDAQKWFWRHGWAFAISGRMRLVTVLGNHLNDLLADLAGPADFAERVADQLHKHRIEGERSKGLPTYDSGMLLTRPGELWELDGCLGVRPVRAFAACGSGWQYAFGAWHAMQNTLKIGTISEAPYIVEAALAAAGAFDVNSGGPPFVARLTAGGVRVIAGGGALEAA